AVTTHVRGADASRADLVDGDRRTPLSSDQDVTVIAFVPPNQLLFLRIETNPGAWAAPFDGQTLDLTKAVLIEPRATALDASRDGTLVSGIPERERRELVWVSRTGTIAAIPGSAFESARPSIALSVDGKRAALSVTMPDGKDEFVVRDLTMGADTRLPTPRA